MADPKLSGALTGTRVSGRPKKKSHLARLAEKQKQKKEDGDLGGSAVSLQETKKPRAVDGASSGGPHPGVQPSQVPSKDTEAAGEKSLKRGNNGDYHVHLEPEIIIKSDSRQNSTEAHPYRPPVRPRRKSNRVGCTPDTWESPVPVDMDVDASDNEEINKKSPSDTTIHRFRNLRMASERSESVESLKQSPFVPKPPTLPRKGSLTSGKGEKRGRDPYSSSEELDSANKKGGILVSTKAPREMNPRSTRSARGAVRTDGASESRGNEGGALSVQGAEGASGETDLDSTLVAVSQEYEKVMNSKSPRHGSLQPLTPRSFPPPLHGDVVAHSMRTVYKTDPAYRPRADSMVDSASQRSYASGSVLQTITTKSARTRSFLVGSVNTGSSMLLGADELDRYFPERKVNIWVGSWNMNEVKEILTSMDDFILPEVCEYVQDVYVVGTQENEMNKREWEIRLQETIGPSHVLFHSATHGALHLAVFLRRDLIWFCSLPEADQISIRAITMVKTKGAVAICFSFFGTTFLFINCHLTSDDSQLKARIKDYEKISHGLKLPKAAAGSSKGVTGDVTNQFDRVFWFGDLNFRIARLKAAVESRIEVILEQEHPNFEQLLGGDELLQSINEGKIFEGYQEGRINFSPTYKFDANSDKYDTSAKSRIPSYTDRILFKSKRKNAISCIHYDSAKTVRVSDHRPVYGVFEASIRPGHMSVQLAAGQFEREVYLEANRRRAEQMAGQTSSAKSSTVCSIQ